MSRQFSIGERLNVNGTAYRVERGLKFPDDQRLDIWTPDPASPGVWRAVSMRAIGLEVAFMLENEDHRYWRPGQLGGDYFAEWLDLCRTDWRTATYKLAREKALAR